MTAVPLLLGLLLAPVQAQEVPTYDEAAAIARSGDHPAALDAFRRIVSANPGDHDSRVWIGRLLGWLGREREAESVLRRVLLENEQHVDAMVVLGGLLLNMGRLDEGMRVLAAAEEWEAESPDVLAALARGFRFRGELSTALEYIERAITIVPAPEYRLAREQILRLHAHRVEINGFEEQFTAAIPRGRTGDVGVNLRITDRLRLGARAQVQDKFDTGDSRGGVSLEWRVRPHTSFAASVLGGPDNTVLPQVDVAVDGTRTSGRLDWQGGYRYVRFGSATVSLFAPGAAFSLTDGLLLGGRYYLARTAFRDSSQTVTSHAASIRLSLQVHPRMWTTGGYARGTESFETLSPDRIGRFTADTASGGVRVELPGLTTLAGVYERQWRTRGTNMGRLTLSIVQRF